MKTVENIMLAYGCGLLSATAIKDRSTRFAQAVGYFGPLLCHYHKQSMYWSLYGRPIMAEDLIAAAARRRCAVGDRVSEILRLRSPTL